MGILLSELRNNGYLEGKNLVMVRRATAGQTDRIPAIAAELVGLGVDVLVTVGNDAALAARSATSTMPIVVTNVSDPVAIGLAASLSRPGGNVTGMADLSTDLWAKRIELLKAAVPRCARLAFIWDDIAPQFGASRFDALIRAQDAAADAFGIRLLRIRMESRQDFPDVLATLRREQIDAILAGGEPVLVLRTELADFAIQRRLPLVMSTQTGMDTGALMAYTADFDEMFRKAGTYVAKIFAGASPADLPFEQPTKFKLMINLRTAAAIGVTIPPSLLARADDLIE